MIHRLFVLGIVYIRVKFKGFTSGGNVIFWVIHHGIHLTLWMGRLLQNAVLLEFSPYYGRLLFSTCRFFLIQRWTDKSTTWLVIRLDCLRMIYRTFIFMRLSHWVLHWNCVFIAFLLISTFLVKVIYFRRFAAAFS